MKKIIGYYNADGYHIDELDGATIYTAGNNPKESSSIIDRAFGLPLETIREFCEKTGRQIAEEMGAKFVGIEEDEKGEGEE